VHWATRDLPVSRTASASYPVSPIFCKSLPTRLFQFALGLPGPLLKSGISRTAKLFGRGAANIRCRHYEHSAGDYSKHVNEPVKPLFPDYVLHLLPIYPWPNVTVFDSVFPRNTQDCSLPSIRCAAESSCTVKMLPCMHHLGDNFATRSIHETSKTWDLHRKHDPSPNLVCNSIML